MSWRIGFEHGASSDWAKRHAEDHSVIVVRPFPPFAFGESVAAFSDRSTAELAIRCVNLIERLAAERGVSVEDYLAERELP